MPLLAVNGTLMRGLELEPNMLAAGATFVCEAATAPLYRLFDCGRHPGMLRVSDGSGVAVALELWDVPPAGLGQILEKEPAGAPLMRSSQLPPDAQSRPQHRRRATRRRATHVGRPR